MSSDVHLMVAPRLRRAGQRYTSNRRALVEILEAAKQPLAMPDILAHGRSLALSSVYRNLAVLERTGVVHRIVSTGEFARFELAEDLSGHHHHMICSSCGGVEDFTIAPALERSVERAMATMAGRRGFEPEGHRIDLVGLCQNCG